jgi:predicted DNA-binding transcriptional regulator AlpA
MKQLEAVNDIQKLLKRQKAYMNGILVMQEKLFNIQRHISELMLKEAKQEKQKERKPSELLSSKDVCSMFEFSPSTLYRMRMYDGFPYVKVEGRRSVLFNKKDVVEYMEKHKKQGL